MSEVCDKFEVVLQSKTDPSIYVHVSEHQVLRFQRCSSGLYYVDLNANSEPFTQYTFFSTVRANKEFFSPREIQRADNARQLQANLAWPSTADFKSYVKNNLLINCETTVDDISRAEAIYGPQVPMLRGKMVRKMLNEFTTLPRTPLPTDVAQHHPTDEIDMDFFFVNGNPFLHTKTKVIKFRAVQSHTGRGKVETSNTLKTIIAAFEMSGIKITGLNGDNEFEKIRELVQPVPVHIAGREEHIGRIERDIRTIEERCRCYCSAMPFKRITKLLLSSIIEEIILCLNDFPGKNGVSKTLSPSAIILGRPKRDCSNLTITPGAYAEIKEQTTNTMKYRSTGAIALRPSNGRGGYYFQSLTTGRQVHVPGKAAWTELPTPQHVIDHFEEMARAEGQPIMNNKVPIFEWAPGVPILDDDQYDDHDVAFNEDDEVADVVPPPRADGPNDTMSIPADSDDDADSLDPAEDDPAPEIEPITDDSDDDTYTSDIDHVETEERHIDNDSDSDSEDTPSETEEREHDDIEAETQERENNAPDAANSDSDDDKPVSTTAPTVQLPDEDADDTQAPRRGTRTRRAAEHLNVNDMQGKSYRKDAHQYMQYALHEFLRADSHKQQRAPTHRDVLDAKYRASVAVMFNQMTAKKGIEKFGEVAIAAMFKEYAILDNLDVFGTIDPDKLTLIQKQRALRAINLIKEKRCGRVRGRTCADGRSQRAYVPREEAASPTVSTEALLATLLIDAKEQRDVAVFDVPSAYLHADMPAHKFVVLKIEGDFVDIMCDVNPKYKPFVRKEFGKKVLYLQILKALYGCIESALLWYNTYHDTLKQMGFEINKVDPCVANKIINGKQCTITWYVDDNKLSHKDPQVVTDILNEIEKVYPGLVTTRGKEHTLLGMKIIFNKNGSLSIDTREYIHEAIDDFNEAVDTKVCSPAAHGLFNVDVKSPKLSATKADTFHRVVAKLLWVMKRGRPDIETAISMLCTRVQEPTEQDWGKLKRLIQFLKKTINDIRILAADNLGDIFTWIDASYAVHPNMRSHTGGTMSMGLGVVHAKSSKQKLNTKSSTEAEVVGTSDYLPHNLHFTMFLREQGYPIDSNVMYQDNQSAIRMITNGRMSCTSNSKHVDIRYFFIKDRVDKKEIQIAYCPTDEMLADYFTKPLQGALFNKLRRVIMGWDHISTLNKKKKSDTPVPEERVGSVPNGTSGTGDDGTNNGTKATTSPAKPDSDVDNKKHVTWADVARGPNKASAATNDALTPL